MLEPTQVVGMPPHLGNRFDDLIDVTVVAEE